MATFGVLLAVVAFCANSAYGIRCYSCDSSKNMPCDWYYASTHVPTVDCNDQNQQQPSEHFSTLGTGLNTFMPQQCMKIVGYDHQGRQYISRGCTSNTGPVQSCQMMAKNMQFGEYQDLQRVDCWTCNYDYCNSAPKISAAIGVAIGIISACVVLLL